MIDIVVGIDPGHCTGYAVLLCGEHFEPVLFENGVVPFYPDPTREKCVYDFWVRLFQRLPECNHLVFCYEANVGSSFGQSFFFVTEQSTSIVLGQLAWQALGSGIRAQKVETIDVKNIEIGRLFGIKSSGKKQKGKDKVKVRSIRDLVRETVTSEFALDASGLSKCVDVWDAIILARAGVYKIFGDWKDDRMILVHCDDCRTTFVVESDSYVVCKCGNIMAKFRAEGKLVVDVRVKNNKVKDHTRVISIDNSVPFGHESNGACSIVSWNDQRLMVAAMEIEHRQKVEKEA